MHKRRTLMKILVLTTSGFAPTHTAKLLSQIDYLNSFSDMDVVVQKDLPLADIEHLIMTHSFDCVYPTTVFEHSHDRKNIVAFNKTLYQILEYHCQAYTGSDLFVHMLLNDKALTNIRCNMSLPNKLLTKNLWKSRQNDAKRLVDCSPFPVIVKPNTLAASLGISKASIAFSSKEAIDIIEKQFEDFPNLTELLLEHYLETAQEYTVSVTGNGKKSICSTTALISRTREYEIFSYTNKNLRADQRSLEYTSKIPERYKILLKEKALYLSQLLRVRDYSRFDFLMDQNEHFYLIDANSLPSLGSNYFLEYIDQQLFCQEKLLALIILVFCQRTGQSYPRFIGDISNEILRYII